MIRDTRTANAGEIQAARLLLDRLGVSVEQLLDPASTSDLPTFDVYIARVSEAVTKGTLRVYETYWNRVRDIWGDRRLDEPTALEIQQLAEKTKAMVVVRRNARGGHLAAEHMIAMQTTPSVYRWQPMNVHGHSWFALSDFGGGRRPLRGRVGTARRRRRR